MKRFYWWRVSNQPHEQDGNVGDGCAISLGILVAIVAVILMVVWVVRMTMDSMW